MIFPEKDIVVTDVLIPSSALFMLKYCIKVKKEAKAYSESKEASKQLLAKIVNGFKPLTILRRSSILDV